jgi:hypothetical protein
MFQTQVWPVDVGRAHRQHPIFIGRRRHALQGLGGDVFGDHRPQRRRVFQRVRGEQAENASVREDVGAGDLRVHILQDRIVGGGAEKGVRRQQRTGADATHRIELWPLPAFGPAFEEARAEGAVLATAGQ